MEENVKNFSIGDIVQFIRDGDINFDINEDWFDIEFIIYNIEGKIENRFGRVLYLKFGRVLYLKDEDGNSYGGYFAKRFELVNNSKQLSVESLTEYEGMFE